MHSISWTLRSGSEQFIYNWNQDNADLDQGTGATGSKKERTTNAMEKEVVLRQHANRSRVKATCKRKSC
jgi:hypothetical protein